MITFHPNMQEATIKKIAVFVTIIGLSFLFIYSQNIELEPNFSLDDIPLDKEIKIKGRISKLSTQNKAIFLEVDGERIETTSVILFADEDLYLKENDYVELTGKVEEYKGKKEIIASKIVIK